LQIPLYNKQWRWTELEQTAFDELKWRICESLVLRHADTTQKFILETDASDYAYGAMLSQKGEDRKFHPMAFYSKSMTPAERNYGISDKEALAIIKALQHWCHWLEGTTEPIRIITDHRNLEYFKNPHPLNRRQLRWLEQLTHFNYKISYCPSDMNSVADALSRMLGLKPEMYEEKRPTTLLDPDCFIAALVTDPPTLEANEYVQLLTDGQLLDQISDETLAIDPLDWPLGYELNNDLVLASKETG
jgi:hypothetical protein